MSNGHFIGVQRVHHLDVMRNVTRLARITAVIVNAIRVIREPNVNVTNE